MFITSLQVEQQDSILTQLQNELRAERDRHQETGRQLQNARHTNSDLEDTLETNQKDIKELSNKVCGEVYQISLSKISLCYKISLLMIFECY